MTNELSKKMLQRGIVKVYVRRIAGLLTIIGLVYAMFALVYASQTIFKVKLNYAVVLERFGGSREAVTEVGWHGRLPFFTKIEQIIPLMNQVLFLGKSSEPMRIISKENVALWASAALTFRITDLKIWAIENLAPHKLLQEDYDGIVKDILQAHRVDDLISDREKIKEKIYKALKSRPINEGGPTLEQKYGILVVSFVLQETRFGDKLIEATEEKKRRELIAEADNYAADQEASRIIKLYTAYMESIEALKNRLGGPGEPMSEDLLEFLVQQKWATAYEKNQTGQNTVVIQNTKTAPALTLPPVFEDATEPEAAQEEVKP